MLLDDSQTPDNILVNGADCNIKITGFGKSSAVCNRDDGTRLYNNYNSPEELCSADVCDESVDIWSLGCIFAELFLRRPLFGAIRGGANHRKQLKMILEVLGTPEDLAWIRTSEAKRWVLKQQSGDGKPLKDVFANGETAPSSTTGTTESASDGALEMMDVLLKVDPKHRHSSLQCLRHPYLKEIHDWIGAEEGESTCPPFELPAEFESATETTLEVRLVMFDTLTDWQRKN